MSEGPFSPDAGNMAQLDSKLVRSKLYIAKFLSSKYVNKLIHLLEMTEFKVQDNGHCE